MTTSSLWPPFFFGNTNHVLSPFFPLCPPPIRSFRHPPYHRCERIPQTPSFVFRFQLNFSALLRHSFPPHFFPKDHMRPSIRRSPTVLSDSRGRGNLFFSLLKTCASPPLRPFLPLRSSAALPTCFVRNTLPPLASNTLSPRAQLPAPFRLLLFSDLSLFLLRPGKGCVLSLCRRLFL